MKHNEIIGTIDCTPTWQDLLLPMLHAYLSMNRLEAKREKTINSVKDLETEFKNMAAAADKWNEHCKTVN